MDLLKSIKKDPNSYEFRKPVDVVSSLKRIWIRRLLYNYKKTNGFRDCIS